jgi:hypothetical protein
MVVRLPMYRGGRHHSVEVLTQILEDGYLVKAGVLVNAVAPRMVFYKFGVVL